MANRIELKEVWKKFIKMRYMRKRVLRRINKLDRI